MLLFFKGHLPMASDIILNREQIVVTDSNDGQRRYSALTKVQHGIPQGSLLSPILYVICRRCTKSYTYYTYTALLKVKIPRMLSRTSSAYSDWSTNNSLFLNPS